MIAYLMVTICLTLLTCGFINITSQSPSLRDGDNPAYNIENNILVNNFFILNNDFFFGRLSFGSIEWSKITHHALGMIPP